MKDEMVIYLILACYTFMINFGEVRDYTYLSKSKILESNIYNKILYKVISFEYAKLIQNQQNSSGELNWWDNHPIIIF